MQEIAEILNNVIQVVCCMVSKLKEIAELAGVSELTVSRALNNSSLISEKTRQVVINAARQLQYQTTRVGLIGVIEPKITNPLYSEVVASIEARAYEEGYGDDSM